MGMRSQRPNQFAGSAPASTEAPRYRLEHLALRVLRLLAPAVIILCAVTLPSARPIEAGGFVTVTSPDGLNLRSGPSTGAAVELAIPYGSVLAINGDSTPDGWYPVSFGGLSGWVDGSYVTQGVISPGSLLSAPSLSTGSVPPPPPPPPAAPSISAPPATLSTVTSSAPATTSTISTALTMVVTASGGLNLRAAPDTAATVLTTIPTGSAVQVVGGATPNTWYPVRFNGTSGWADGAYLSANSALGASSSTSIGSSASSSSILNAATFGNPALGTPAPPESGLTPTSAPASANGMFIWPVAGPHRISTVFQPAHQAIDIDQFANPSGPVTAIADGIVTYAGGNYCCSYGLYVIIQHANGYSSLYAHFSSTEVSVGQMVHQGQEIGRVGCSGFCTGPHVHFAIYYNNQPLDPTTVLSSSDVSIEAGAQFAVIDPSIGSRPTVATATTGSVPSSGPTAMTISRN